MEQMILKVTVHIWLNTKESISVNIYSKGNLHDIEIIDLLYMPGYLKVRYSDNDYEIVAANCVESYAIIRFR
jgi:hypothetical protein